MTISNQISQGGVTMGVASSSYVTSPSKTYSRTPIRSSGTIVSITPGGEITPIGTVSTAPRVTKPYPYPRSNAAAATMMGGSPVVSQPVVPPMSIIPPDQLLENQCDLCSKVYKNRSTLYSHKNRDHGIRGGAAMNNPKNWRSIKQYSQRSCVSIYIFSIYFCVHYKLRNHKIYTNVNIYVANNLFFNLNLIVHSLGGGTNSYNRF